MSFPQTTHFEVRGGGSACGRGSNFAAETDVRCGNCRKSLANRDAFVAANKRSPVVMGSVRKSFAYYRLDDGSFYRVRRGIMDTMPRWKL